MFLLKTKNYQKSSASFSKKEMIWLFSREKLLEKNLFDPRLHTKKLNGFPDNHVYSFRITRAYRGIFRLSDGGVILFAIGHRKDIYRSL